MGLQDSDPVGLRPTRPEGATRPQVAKSYFELLARELASLVERPVPLAARLPAFLQFGVLQPLDSPGRRDLQSRDVGSTTPQTLRGRYMVPNASVWAYSSSWRRSTRAGSLRQSIGARGRRPRRPFSWRLACFARPVTWLVWSPTWSLLTTGDNFGAWYSPQLHEERTVSDRKPVAELAKRIANQVNGAPDQEDLC